MSDNGILQDLGLDTLAERVGVATQQEAQSPAAEDSTTTAEPQAEQQATTEPETAAPVTTEIPPADPGQEEESPTGEGQEPGGEGNDQGEDLDTYEDFSIGEPSTTQRTAEKENVSTPKFLDTLGSKLGQAFKSEDDVVSYIESLKKEPEKEVVRQPYLPGLDDETASVVTRALEEEILTLEEVASGKLLTQFAKFPADPTERARYIEDLAHDYLIAFDQLGAGKMTSEEAMAQIEEMSDVEKGQIARAYALEMDAQRKGIIDRVSANLSARAQEKEQKALQNMRAKEEFSSQVRQALKEMDVVRGTKTRLTEEQKLVISKVATDEKLLQRALFGSGDTPDVSRAVNLLARILYPKTIDKDIRSASLNEATKSLIDRESNIQVGPKGSPVTTVGATGSNPQKEGVAQIRQWMNQ